MFLSLLDALGYGAVRFTAFVVRRLPLETALTLGRSLGEFIYFFNKRRQLAYANLKSAFPKSTADQRKRWTKEMFGNLGMNAVEMMRFPLLTAEDVDHYVTYHGCDAYLKHRQSGKGLILLTAHIANWELPQVCEAIQGRPLMVLARRQKYPRLDTLLNSFRQCHGSLFIGKGREIRDLIRGLRAGGCVAIAGDQSGGDSGIWVQFFGRLTTAPRGPIALALKWGFTVMPTFFVREKGPYHHIFLKPPLELERTGDSENDLRINTEKYLKILESFLAKYPSQWLWGHKRWKRTRTKRITILSDGKAGHRKQSEALVREVTEGAKRAHPSYETLVETIEVEFRSPWRKYLFPFFAFFFIPWAQGRLSWLGFFIQRESLAKLESAVSDLVVSAGSSLVPLNLCLARENLAKSAILMKPSFPFNLFRYDLALIPAHDEGPLPRGHFRTQGVLSAIDHETLEVSKKRLAATLANADRVRLSLFLGGETRHLKLSLAEVENLILQLERASEKLDGDYLVTTSRRTPERISRFLQEKLKDRPRCQLCVIAAEDRRPEVVPGMMALADFLMVTEDSLSMISEALSSGKNVVVVKWATDNLPPKHYRFQETLKTEWGVPVVRIDHLAGVLTKGGWPSVRERLKEERFKIREKVESLL